MLIRAGIIEFKRTVLLPVEQEQRIKNIDSVENLKMDFIIAH